MRMVLIAVTFLKSLPPSRVLEQRGSAEPPGHPAATAQLALPICDCR